MNSQNGTKINKLLQIWLKQTIAVQAWLKKQGIDRHLADVYCKNKWLTRLAPGVYTRYKENVDWSGALHSLQYQLDLKVHLAATSALTMAGLGHYLPLGNNSTQWIFMDASETRKIPTWFTKYFGQGGAVRVLKTNLIEKTNEFIDEIEINDYKIKISSPELAVLECVYLVPEKISFEYASLLIEQTRNLRPAKIQKLLQSCQSIKAKRILLYLSEIHQHGWFHRLDISKINLGSGTRKIGDGGKYIGKYKLSVPKQQSYEGTLSNETEI